MFKEAVIDGLWKQNPGTIQLLGLCPTLAITTSVINGKNESINFFKENKLEMGIDV